MCNSEILEALWRCTVIYDRMLRDLTDKGAKLSAYQHTLRELHSLRVKQEWFGRVCAEDETQRIKIRYIDIEEATENFKLLVFSLIIFNKKPT